MKGSRGDALAQNLIDLTSDGEDAERVNDGLPGFRSTPDGKLRRDGASGQNYTKAYPRHATVTSRIVPRISNGPQTGISRSGNFVLGSTRTQFPRPEDQSRRALDESEHNTLHVPKRRKISEGHTDSRPSSGMITAEAQNGRSSQAVIMRDMRVVASLDSPREKQSERSARKRSSRVSPSGQIQKSGTIVPNGVEAARLQQVLKTQVFVHINNELRLFASSITTPIRKLIGENVVYDLIDDPSFIPHFKSNEFSLSSDYETQLAQRAKTFVARYVQDALNGQDIKARNTSRNQEELPKPKPVIANPHRASADSTSSAEPEEVFERRENTSHSSLHRRSSISPSTPQSSDVPERNSYNDAPMASIELETVRVAENAAERRLPGRSSRAAQPSYTHKIRQRRWYKKPAGFDDAKSSSTASPSVRLGSVKRSATPQTATPQTGPLPVAAPQVIEVQYEKKIIITRRPYLGRQEREALVQNLQRKHASGKVIAPPNDFSSSHVPFSDAESELLIAFIKKVAKRTGRSLKDPFREIVHLMASLKGQINRFTKLMDYDDKGSANLKTLQGRDAASISAFLQDAAENCILQSSTWTPPPPKAPERSRVFDPISVLLRQRETHGMEPVRVRRALIPYRQVVTSYMEDCLVPKTQWTDCSGDIAALTWTNDDAFVVGALTHFDPKHMQYNKPGNLAVGSTSNGTLKSYPDHKIVRPVISSDQDKVNALESMRQTQDPWLYASVVSASYSAVSGFTFTSSFDNTAKVWKVSPDGSSMGLCGIWQHEARVNFVATSEHHDRVATASETHNDAVRIYNFDSHAISDSPYDQYGGNKAQQQAGDTVSLWAYQPATMKWARAPKVANLLLVGYSPRAPSGEDSDIPDDKKNTGELCVWDYSDGSRTQISSSRTANVFEAVWHPTQPMFAAATSPSGNYDTDRTRTQVRLFALNDTIFTLIIALDCPALDINELTIMPNSTLKAFVTASCTNGKTYVWDTAQGEDAIHVLEHGETLDTPDTAQGTIPVELVDGGVTFASWGATVDRFYTGATDGNLKTWDIRRPPGKTFVRNVLELTGGISSGAFSGDFRQLLIGDSTGKVHLLGIDDNGDSSDEQEAPKENRLNARDVLGNSGILSTNVKRPKPIIPHSEPPPPMGYEMVEDTEQSIQEITRPYLEEGMLRRYPGRGVFQGLNYGELGLYRFDAHEDSDGSQPLLPEYLENQQYLKYQEMSTGALQLPTLPIAEPANKELQKKNEGLNFEFAELTLETQEQLEEDDVDLEWDWDYTTEFQYELLPRDGGFKVGRERKSKKKKKSRMVEDVMEDGEADETSEMEI